MEKDPFTIFAASSLKWRLSCQKTSEYPMSEKRSRWRNFIVVNFGELEWFCQKMCFFVLFSKRIGRGCFTLCFGGQGFAMTKRLCKMQVMTLGFSISTERLQLTPLEESDIDEIYATLSAHPEICEFLTFDPPTCRKDTEDFVEYCKKNFPKKEVVWCVRTQKKEFVGLAGLHDIRRTELAWQFDMAEIGYWIAPQWQGKGIATEMARAIVFFGMNNLELHKIKAGHVLDNAASARVLEKIGFQEVGIRRDHFKRYGTWWDYRLLELLSKNFEQ